MGLWDSKCFSDIDDFEIGQYLCNEEERCFKKIIWEEMNKDYLKEKAVKEAMAVAVTKGTCQADLSNGSVKMLSPQELAAAIAKKCKKNKKQNHGVDKSNSADGKSPLERTSQVLKRKFSSKINYAALESLHEDNAKRQRMESEAAEIDSGELKAIDGKQEESDGEAAMAKEENGGKDDEYYGNGDDDYYGHEDDVDYYDNGDDDYHDGWDE